LVTKFVEMRQQAVEMADAQLRQGDGGVVPL